MIGYFILSNTGAIGGGKFYKWTAGSYVETPQVGMVVKRNLNGGNSESVGFSKFGCSFEAQFPYTGDGTYGGYADLIAIFEGTTAAQRKVKFQGIDGTAVTYDMLVVNQPVLKPMKNSEYKLTNPWRCTVQLVQQ
jgi:hypothetical protein